LCSALTLIAGSATPMPGHIGGDAGGDVGRADRLPRRGAAAVARASGAHGGDQSSTPRPYCAAWTKRQVFVSAGWRVPARPAERVARPLDA
jgi:hypothetical protein